MAISVALVGFLLRVASRGMIKGISVAAAIILYDLVSRLRGSSIAWNLDERELVHLKLQWLRNSIRHPDIIDRFMIDNQKFDSEE